MFYDVLNVWTFLGALVGPWGSLGEPGGPFGVLRGSLGYPGRGLAELGPEGLPGGPGESMGGVEVLGVIFKLKRVICTKRIV